jgi:oxygen-independent coproporphyrinogen III oxidase
MSTLDLVDIDPAFLLKFDQPVPRYTSYPTAIQFQPLAEEEYAKRLQSCSEPVSLYIHIPFCRSMCLFCACSVVLNRDPAKQASYLQSLLGEIELVASKLPRKVSVSQIHLGGGTPTNLTEKEFSLLYAQIERHFQILENAEISIEVDPRNVFADKGKKLSFLRKLGFNRISFGVQDADPDVQEAVKRRQSWEMTEKTFWLARELGFSGINLDLIYGLPLQTPEKFADTAEKILALGPDRIAFFSYAKVPWLKQHQKAIPDALLPSTIDKFRIYVETRAKFMRGGYSAIGMDHFAKDKDSLTSGYLEKKLYRNFQGYSLQLAENMIGLGVTAIGYVEGCYAQNEKEIALYHKRIAEKRLPVLRGRVLTGEDHLRRYVIQKLMCDFSIDKDEFRIKFGIDFDEHFRSIDRSYFIKEELIEENGQNLSASAPGRLFIRNIAALFDEYYTAPVGTFSKGV